MSGTAEAAEMRMDVDELLVGAEGREGKFELHDGRVVEMTRNGRQRALCRRASPIT